MIDPEISVIIPFYNRKETLRRSVASVLKQTFSNLELILVDDGSTDGSIETLGDLNDARLVVITQKNQGACQARNAGIFAARGKYIAFQDSDDVWRPDKLEKQITELKRTNSDVCFCRFQRHDTSGASIDVWPRINAGPVFEDDLVKESIVSTQTILAKREIFNHKMFNGGLKRLQDYEWVISTC